MSNIFNKSFCVIIFVIFLSGCAQLQASKGWGLLDKGQPDEAIKAFEMSREKKELPGYYLGMYHSYVEKKDTDNAEKYIVLGVERFPDDFHLNYAYGYFLLKVKDNGNAAIKYFEKCKQLDSSKEFMAELESLINEAKG